MRTPRELWTLIYRTARKNGRADMWRKEDYLETRARFAARIADCAEQGKVALVWSGRDCDCVSYSNSVAICDATLTRVERDVDQTMHWADGPCGFYIERPSVARKLRRTSRDLALEAFEDGHPHVVYADTFDDYDDAYKAERNTRWAEACEQD